MKVSEETDVNKEEGHGRVVLEVLEPCGEKVTEAAHAKRVSSLEGKTICEVSNAGWEHDRIFPVLRQLLKQRFPTAKIIPYTEVPVGRGVNGIDTDRAAEAVLAMGADAVVTGMAG